ncbi:hypothetical protein IMCC3317_44580 [Kordia antarctica]|uniref:Uncharacterized protein n=1 Tax=Kordia antarctica TaxID=1218801 RepID=A0A7L4ZRC4_9FLAO|nr:hypothetical protein [Kordia antarctica]QHI39057.1 hypothetical protein IMCC3317_44580 [Kordia antarctica]
MSDNIDWGNLANQAADETDAEFSTTITSLTNISITEINEFIKQSEISNANAVKVLQEINNAAASNTAKADAIANIDNGVSFLISLATKVV